MYVQFEWHWSSQRGTKRILRWYTLICMHKPSLTSRAHISKLLQTFANFSLPRNKSLDSFLFSWKYWNNLLNNYTFYVYKNANINSYQGTYYSIFIIQLQCVIDANKRNNKKPCSSIQIKIKTRILIFSQRFKFPFQVTMHNKKLYLIFVSQLPLHKFTPWNLNHVLFISITGFTHFYVEIDPMI